MEPYQETTLKLGINQAIEGETYRALRKIKAALEDDSLDHIEKIILIFEGMESDGGSRHDFG